MCEHESEHVCLGVVRMHVWACVCVYVSHILRRQIFLVNKCICAWPSAGVSKVETVCNDSLSWEGSLQEDRLRLWEHRW